MDELDISDQIARLEDRIEVLAAELARCRKIAVGAKIAVGCGAAWFALLLVQFVWFNATAFVAALSAVLGGVVLLGSNATTWAQTESALAAAEASRAELIGAIDLRLVGEDGPTLH